VLAGAVVLIGGFGGFWAYSAQAIHSHEQRVIAGDFPSVHLQTGSATVDGDGKVAGDVAKQDPQMYVASLNLIPPGQYQAVIVADDSVASRREKAEIVIAGQDPKGQWHPASAPQILARLKTTQPGTAR
jgi:hypothetical protein